MTTIIEEMEAAGATEPDVVDAPAPKKRTGKPAAPKNEDKRSRYFRIMEPRVNAALRAIRVVGLIGGNNKHRYDFGDTDTDVVLSALNAAVADTAAKLRRKPTQIPMFILPRQGKNGSAGAE